MLQSRLERVLDRNSRERSFSAHPYRVLPAKRDRIGFSTGEPEVDTAKETGAPFTARVVPVRTRSEQEFHELDQEITAANFVLNIENDLESEDFVPYSREVLSCATGFLRRMMIHAHSANIVGLGIPHIGPADAGSIDLHWEKSDRTLLINFSASKNMATYYGRKAKSEISGRFDPSEARPELVIWLAD